jgi:hypothetical protein
MHSLENVSSYTFKLTLAVAISELQVITMPAKTPRLLLAAMSFFDVSSLNLAKIKFPILSANVCEMCRVFRRLELSDLP